MDLFKLPENKLKELLNRVLESYGDEYFNKEGNAYFYVTPKIKVENVCIEVTIKDMLGNVHTENIRNIYYPNYEDHYNMRNITLSDLMVDCMMED